MLEFDVAWSHFDVAWGHFDVAWQKLWHKNDVFDEILGCAGHLTLPKKKWAPVAIKIFYKYAVTAPSVATKGICFNKKAQSLTCNVVAGIKLDG